ncbi:uncharacterized protein [Antedon mediterranea]|uniref:uncharacterized protein n=1 Tax=Antedon mediterranea TaxID=105859 RepID=UPI003AF663A1
MAAKVPPAVCVRFEGLSQPYPTNLNDKLQLYFQSYKKSGGGDIDSVKIHSNTQDDDPFAIIIFDQLESAKRVLVKKNHSLLIGNMEIGLLVEGAEMSEDIPVDHTSPPSPQFQSTSFGNSSYAEDIYGNDQQGETSCSREISMTQQHVDNSEDLLNTPNDDPPGDGGDNAQLFIEVSFGGLTLDTVLMYFESKRHSGGGSIGTHKLVKPGVVHIAFEQQKTVIV